MNYIKQQIPQKKYKTDRIWIIKALLILIGCLLVARLFYVQIIKHESYKAKALAEHTKKFQIPADRGLIKMKDGSSVIPVVLNEKKYEVFADPKFVDNSKEAAVKLTSIIGGDQNALYKNLATDSSRYVIIAKKIGKEQAERIKELKLKGVGLREVSVRTYPQGSLASQVLGFVNDDGEGQYGVEGFLNKELVGDPGTQKAITDINGVPLAINNDNVIKNPKAGTDYVLSIDIKMQRIIEEALKNGIDRTKATRGDAVVLDPSNGQIKAMANIPTYDPNQYQKIEDLSLFSNNTVSMPWEPGSVMKPLLMGQAFSMGALNPGSKYYDAGFAQIDDRRITNSLNWGAQTMSMQDIISKSLNTGAVYMLKTIGGGDINESARQKYYDQLVNKYQFGKQTGIEQSGESAGYVSKPEDDGAGINVRYGNMAFGQGLTVTPLQLAAAYAALVNGGTYYQPTLISEIQQEGKIIKNEPKIKSTDVVTPTTSSEIKEILKKGLEANNSAAVRNGYQLGAKSGTAQVAENGNYKTDAYNGVYVGYLAGEKLEYIIVVRLDEPKTPGFASGQAAITWAEISNQLINNMAIKPKAP